MARRGRDSDPGGLPGRDEILAWIRDNPDRASRRDIAKAFGLKAAHRAELTALLKSLAEEGLASFAWQVPSLASDASGEVAYPVKDFYLTNAICRASPTMQRCSAEILHGEEFAEAAE